jgi:hypothetical protein
MAHLEQISPGTYVDPFAVKAVTTHREITNISADDKARLHFIGGDRVTVPLTPEAAVDWVNAARDGAHDLLHHAAGGRNGFPHASTVAGG